MWLVIVRVCFCCFVFFGIVEFLGVKGEQQAQVHLTR